MSPHSAQLRPPVTYDAPETNARSTRRPLRKSAGRKSLPAGFVSSGNADGIDLSSDDGELTDGALTKRWMQKAVAKPRPLSPSHYREPPPSPRATSSEPEQGANPPHFASTPETVSLTFHVPTDHVGPFVVNLNLRDLGAPSAGMVSSPASKVKRRKLSHHPNPASVPPVSQYAGFTDLPPELRNIVYKEVFGSGKTLDFGRPDFALSSQFLRTCKLVSFEGTVILYSSHSFKLSRDNSTEGPYWKKPWTEIGWRNIRRWLVDIGPLNVSYLRDVEIDLEDGTGRSIILNPNNRLMSESARREAARYVHDGDLIECLKILARFGQLRKLTLHFESRKQLTRRDDRFVHELRKLRVDQLIDKQPSFYAYYGHRAARIEPGLLDDMRKKMVSPNPQVCAKKSCPRQRDPIIGRACTVKDK